ncbi:MAG TPA: helix-turn-helix domain-containing protein [Pseudolabrys sp.]|nr:helix-turn-helix domain-containing protein [Pseudolabrys sp.]
MLTQNAIHTGSANRAVNDAPARARISGCALSDSINVMGVTLPYSQNAEIYGENEPADYVYKVVAGAVRTYKILADGRRQIGAFYLPGDVFGLESDDTHVFSAEAIGDAKILAVRRSTLMSLAARENEVARELWLMMGHELRRVQDHTMLLIKSAKERVVGFLLEMAKRIPSISGHVELPMSRQDIADYLGLTIETVSRSFSDLEDDASIQLMSARKIALRNRRALGQLNA